MFSAQSSYFKKLFKGRLNRRNYLIGNLIPLLLGYTIFSGFFVAIPEIINNNPLAIVPLLSSPMGIFFCTFFIFFSLFGVSLGIRRFHDLNTKGWMYVINYIPYINFLFSIYLAFWPGTKAENNYGKKPQPHFSMKEILSLN